MKVDLNKLQIERNYMQLERDTISTFYDITKKEVKELELEINDALHRNENRWRLL